MKAIVCVKQVPDTSGKVAVKADGTMDRAAMAAITNPDDLAAVEAALRLKETTGCEVVVLSMGPPAAKAMLRDMLAMGCDRAVLVSAREFGGSDTYATSQILAAAIRRIGLTEQDIVLCGRQAIDGDTAQVGPQIAEKLGLPQITYVAEMAWHDGRITARRLLEDGYMLLEAGLPCLLTCVKELNEPRFPTVDGITRSFQQEIELFDYEALRDDALIDPSVIGLKGSPTNVYRSFSPPRRGTGVLFTGPEQSTCRQLVDTLQKSGLL